MKVVAVSQRVDSLIDRNEVRDGLDQKLIQFLVSAGLVPVPVPNTLNRSGSEQDDQNALLHWINAIDPHGIVLSGGNTPGDIQERDWTESALLNHALDRQLPALGICRGMQMMGVWAGATVKAVSGHVGTSHVITGNINRTVNSYHDYVLTGCPAAFEPLARSEDGELEAMCHKQLRWEGWMWHPERDPEFNHDDLERLNRLFH